MFQGFYYYYFIVFSFYVKLQFLSYQIMLNKGTCFLDHCPPSVKLVEVGPSPELQLGSTFGFCHSRDLCKRKSGTFWEVALRLQKYVPNLLFLNLQDLIDLPFCEEYKNCNHRTEQGRTSKVRNIKLLFFWGLIYNGPLIIPSVTLKRRPAIASIL